MKPVINSRHLIGACGLYCGACGKFRREECPGCLNLDFRKLRRSRCRIRRCCTSKLFHTCAECTSHQDVRHCKIYHSPMNRLRGFLLNSDRPACIRFIRERGEEAYAERMAWYEKMTFHKRMP